MRLADCMVWSASVCDEVGHLASLCVLILHGAVLPCNAAVALCQTMGNAGMRMCCCVLKLSRTLCMCLQAL